MSKVSSTRWARSPRPRTVSLRPHAWAVREEAYDVFGDVVGADHVHHPFSSATSAGTAPLHIEEGSQKKPL